MGRNLVAYTQRKKTTYGAAGQISTGQPSYARENLETSSRLSFRDDAGMRACVYTTKTKIDTKIIRERYHVASSSDMSSVDIGK